MEFMLNGTNENVIKEKQARNHEFMTLRTIFWMKKGVMGAGYEAIWDHYSLFLKTKQISIQFGKKLQFKFIKMRFIPTTQKPSYLLISLLTKTI